MHRSEDKTNIRNLLLLFLLALFSTLFVWGQEKAPFSLLTKDLQFEHLTREDDLPSVEITSIFADSRGFLWFGTNDGLVRYDGDELKVYNNDPNSLSSNSINTILEDKGAPYQAIFLMPSWGIWVLDAQIL
ncbi:MAG: hypothetical protein DHS20C18_19360 [Saprospiraceae bacterium]|nr:MAG: hypothetical protein DHS20C18_19360 [Saprospiraceae bacterium]